MCGHLDLGLLVAGMEGRPRAVWMKTGHLADVGERPDIGEALATAAPTNARGPYLLGWREEHWPTSVWETPVWVPKYEIVDPLLPRDDGTRNRFRTVRAAQDLGMGLSVAHTAATHTYPARSALWRYCPTPMPHERIWEWRSAKVGKQPRPLFL